MARVKKQQKRGRGRPKNQPLPSHVLQEQARENIRLAAKRRAAEAAIELPPSPAPEEVIKEASAVTRKHRYTKKEMEELRAKLDVIYKKYLEEQQEEEAKNNRELNKRLYEQALKSPRPSSTAKQMTEEEWNLAHGLRADGTKRRGPAPKPKKKVWDLAPGEKGTTEKPSEPVDLDLMEQEFERQMFERHIEEQKNQPRMVKGKRFRKPQFNAPRPQQPKSFWI